MFDIWEAESSMLENPLGQRETTPELMTRKAETSWISGNYIIKYVLGLEGNVAAGLRTVRTVAPEHPVLTHLPDHTQHGQQTADVTSVSWLRSTPK